MGFDSGSFAFSVCHMPAKMPDDALERFADRKAPPLQYVKDKEELGWVTGRHLLDTRIDDETAYMGGYLHLVLRSAQRKIPPSLLKAECKMAEFAMMEGNNGAFLTRKERKKIKEEVQDRLLEGMPPSLAGTPFVYDPNNDLLYVGAFSRAKIDAFIFFFYDTVGIEPVLLSPELIAENFLDYSIDSVAPLSFSPHRAEGDEEGGLGRDFATWIWYFQDVEGGTFDVPHLGEFGVMVDGPMCFAAEGPGALETVIRKGMPTNSAEAKASLMVGKKIMKAKYIMTKEKQTWVFNLDAATFNFQAVTLPAGEDLDAGGHFQERMYFIDTMRRAFLHLFDVFLQRVNDPGEADVLAAKIHAWVDNLKSL
ncbi:MAG TPA: hypothetical protein DIT01_20130 [Lentisphaeria bacterium]|nr:hypothetical protein [Lentisphaeria bacterium]